MSNGQFAIFIVIFSIIVSVLAYYAIPEPLPAPNGKLLLRDELIRLSE